MKMTLLTRLFGFAALLLMVMPLGAHAQSGLITKAVDLPPLILSSGKPLAEKPYELEAGKYYRLPIEADGTAELAIVGPDFFRNLWINEVVINDIEVRPLGLDSLEFDAAGVAVISFIPIRPGQFTINIARTTSDSQKATFNIK